MRVPRPPALALVLGAWVSAPAPAFALEMTEEEARRTAERLFAVHGYEDVDPGTVEEVVRVILEERVLFGKIAALTTDPEFLPYVERYAALKARHTGGILHPDVRVVMGRWFFEQGTLAYCDHLVRVVAVNPEVWSKVDERFKKAIVFHELGHCDLGRGHDAPLRREWAEGTGAAEGVFSFMDVYVAARMTWPAADSYKTDGWQRLAFDAVYEERFGRDRGRAVAFMEEELFQRSGTLVGIFSKLCPDGAVRRECDVRLVAADEVPALLRDWTVHELRCALMEGPCPPVADDPPPTAPGP